jgi:hypothetical protein
LILEKQSGCNAPGFNFNIENTDVLCLGPFFLSPRFFGPIRSCLFDLFEFFDLIGRHAEDQHFIFGSARHAKIMELPAAPLKRDSPKADRSPPQKSANKSASL